jgi:DHA1 family tetracycline resistance protein-like MFS transporter
LRLPFYVAGALTLVNWLYGFFVLPESLAPANRRPFAWSRSNPVGSLLALKSHPVAFGLAGTHFLINVAHQALPSTWVLYTSFRYGWTSKQVGLSLAVVGLMTGLVQGGLTRVVVKRLGEARTALFGLCIAVLSYAGYGLATEGWMIYVILVFGSLGAVVGPAVQGMISRSVGADEQGGVQGSLMSLASVAGIIGPLIAAALFAHFIDDTASIYLPGAAFFFSSVLVFIGMLLAVRSFRRNGAHPAADEPKVSSPTNAR